MAKKKFGYPPTPKQSSSLQVWERYKAKCQDVDKKRREAEAAKKKKAAVIKSVQSIKTARR